MGRLIPSFTTYKQIQLLMPGGTWALKSLTLGFDKPGFGSEL